MDFTIDRALPVSIRRQIKGLIEYGIACGDLAPGEALPSVRELAQMLGVAPMTVSQVYTDLKHLGLIETRTGSGTSVAENSGDQLRPRLHFAAFHDRIDALIDEGMSLGLRTSDIASLINARLVSRLQHGQRKSVAIVGLFQRTTARYARLIAQQIGRGATVEPTTIDVIQRDPTVRARVASADLVVTFMNRQREVASLLPGARVTSIRFVPAEETRRALATIAPGARLLLVALVPEFLPIMKAGITRFAAHAGTIRSTAGDTAEIASLAMDTDAVIYASGGEDGLVGVPQSVSVIEYTHIPDPADIERRITPLLEGTN